MPRWRVWLLASRPATLPASVVPVVVGTAAAASRGGWRWDVALAALVSALFIQIGTNLANDLFDFQKGADTAGRLGPLRVTQAGLLSPPEVARGMWVSFGLALLVGLYLVAVGGWPILALGLASIAAGILYTAGPWPLGYHGLGDLFTFLFFGLFAVTGTYYLHRGAVDGLALAASLPVAFLVTAILVVNNLRDIETDRAAGKRTLAVRIGAPATRVQYALLVAGAYAVPPALWLAGQASGWAWLPWLSLPLAVRLIRTVVAGTAGPALNRVLKGTGQLHLLFGVLFGLGLAL